MITVMPERDKEKVKTVFAENGFEYNDNSGVVTAKCGDEVLGFCIYYLDDSKMEILKISPTDDLMMADGVLRSTIHVACERFVMDIRYANDLDSDIFKRLDFIKNEEERTLNADKLFGGCHCQG